MGGLNIDDILSVYPTASNALIWIAYIFEVDKKIMQMDDKQVGKHVKYMMICMKDRILHTKSDLSEMTALDFGEIFF
jgi:hypothetical protein